MVFVGDPLQWTSYEQPTLRSSDGSEILAGTPLSMFAALPLGWEGENFLSGKKQVQAQVQIISTPVK